MCIRDRLYNLYEFKIKVEMSSVPDEDNKHNEELIEYLNKHMSFYAKSDYYMASEKFLIAGKFRDMTKRIRTMEVHDLSLIHI